MPILAHHDFGPGILVGADSTTPYPDNPRDKQDGDYHQDDDYYFLGADIHDFRPTR